MLIHERSCYVSHRSDASLACRASCALLMPMDSVNVDPQNDRQGPQQNVVQMAGETAKPKYAEQHDEERGKTQANDH